MRMRGCLTVVPVICVGLAGYALTRPAGYIAPAAPATTAARTSTSVRVRASVLDWRAARHDISSYPECLGRPVTACVLVRGTGKRVLLMGDSLARMWLPAFIAIARRESLTLAVAIHPACPWPKNLGGLGISPDCQVRRADWYKRVIPDVNPDIIFLANRPYDAPGNELTLEVSGRVESTRDPIAIRAIKESTTQSLDALRRRGRELVLLEPTPLPEAAAYDATSCASTGRADCSFTVSSRTMPLTQLDRTLAAASDVWSVDVRRLACPRLPVCDPVVSGVIVWRDHTHLTATYVRAVTDRLEVMLHRQRILGTAPSN